LHYHDDYIPAAKLLALKGLFTEWSARKWCTRVQLESLIDKLHHACLVVWPGRTFLRRMINLLCAFRSRDHPIRLNVAEFRLDLQWWIEFLDDSRQVYPAPRSHARGGLMCYIRCCWRYRVRCIMDALSNANVDCLKRVLSSRYCRSSLGWSVGQLAWFSFSCWRIDPFACLRHGWPTI
jgi:hypothetical protein